MVKKIGILTGGGDVQALNSVIAAVVKAGIPLGYDFIGFEKSWEGVLTPMQYRPLELKDVRGISHIGGTILKTVNKGRFAGKAGAHGEINKIDDALIEEARGNLELIGCEALVVIGGDGTLSGAAQLAEKGVKIIGVPKTIDNDIDSTDKTFGFSSAVEIAVEALDRVHTTATSHDRVIIVETMGRNAGWIALYAGLAGGADVILIPEIEFDYNVIVEFLRKRKTTGYRSAMIAVAEGAKAKNEDVVSIVDPSKPEVQLGGISVEMMKRIEQLAPGEFELRNVVLGHVQRGGIPDADDRMLAKAYGVAAIDAVKNEQWGTMVSLRNNKIITVPLQEAISKLKKVTREDLMFHTAQEMGVCFGE